MGMQESVVPRQYVGYGDTSAGSLCPYNQIRYGHRTVWLSSQRQENFLGDGELRIFVRAPLAVQHPHSCLVRFLESASRTIDSETRACLPGYHM